jgi:hypothetical protein
MGPHLGSLWLSQYGCTGSDTVTHIRPASQGGNTSCLVELEVELVRDSTKCEGIRALGASLCGSLRGLVFLRHVN